MGILSQADLVQEMKANSFRPVYALIGPERFLRRQAMHAIKSRALKPEVFSFNYSEFNLHTVSLHEALNAARTFPFASPRRLVMVTGLESIHEEDRVPLLEYLDEPSGRTILVFDVEELDRRTGTFRALRDKACVVEFANLTGVALSSWAEQFLRSRGLHMGPSALRKLLSLAGSDTESLAHEIEKLALFAGDKKEIPDSAVDDLVQSSRQHRIFELTDAIGKKDRKTAIQLIENLMETGETATGIAAMIGRQFRQILMIKELQRSGRTMEEMEAVLQLPKKSSAFVLEVLLRQARSFDWETTKTIYGRIAEIDSRLRSSRVDPKVILEGLICSI